MSLQGITGLGGGVSKSTIQGGGTEEIGPIAVNGYYPLYVTEDGAAAAGNGTFEEKTINGETYYSPQDGLFKWEGDYTLESDTPTEINGFYPVYKSYLKAYDISTTDAPYVTEESGDGGSSGPTYATYTANAAVTTNDPSRTEGVPSNAFDGDLETSIRFRGKAGDSATNRLSFTPIKAKYSIKFYAILYHHYNFMLNVDTNSPLSSVGGRSTGHQFQWVDVSPWLSFPVTLSSAGNLVDNSGMPIDIAAIEIDGVVVTDGIQIDDDGFIVPPAPPAGAEWAPSDEFVATIESDGDRYYFPRKFLGQSWDGDFGSQHVESLRASEQAIYSSDRHFGWEGIAIGENNSGTIYAIGAPTALDRDGNEVGVDMETADTTNYSTYGSHPNPYRTANDLTGVEYDDMLPRDYSGTVHLYDENQNLLHSFVDPDRDAARTVAHGEAVNFGAAVAIGEGIIAISSTKQDRSKIKDASLYSIPITTDTEDKAFGVVHVFDSNTYQHLYSLVDKFTEGDNQSYVDEAAQKNYTSPHTDFHAGSYGSGIAIGNGRLIIGDCNAQVHPNANYDWNPSNQGDLGHRGINRGAIHIYDLTKSTPAEIQDSEVTIVRPAHTEYQPTFGVDRSMKVIDGKLIVGDYAYGSMYWSYSNYQPTSYRTGGIYEGDSKIFFYDLTTGELIRTIRPYDIEEEYLQEGYVNWTISWPTSYYPYIRAGKEIISCGEYIGIYADQAFDRGANVGSNSGGVGPWMSRRRMGAVYLYDTEGNYVRTIRRQWRFSNNDSAYEDEYATNPSGFAEYDYTDIDHGETIYKNAQGGAMDQAFASTSVACFGNTLYFGCPYFPAMKQGHNYNASTKSSWSVWSVGAVEMYDLDTSLETGVLYANVPEQKTQYGMTVTVGNGKLLVTTRDPSEQRYSANSTGFLNISSLGASVFAYDIDNDATSETGPFAVNGYYPLYNTKKYASAASTTNKCAEITLGGVVYYRPHSDGINVAPALASGQGWLGRNASPTGWTFNGDGTATSGGTWELQTPRTSNVGILDPNTEYTITLVVDSIASGQFMSAAFSRTHSQTNNIIWNEIGSKNIFSPGTYTATATPGGNLDGFVLASYHYASALNATISKLEIVGPPPASPSAWDGDYTESSETGPFAITSNVTYQPNVQVIGSLTGTLQGTELFDGGNNYFNAQDGNYEVHDGAGISFTPLTITSKLELGSVLGGDEIQLVLNAGLPSEVLIPGDVTPRQMLDLDLTQYITLPYVLESISWKTSYGQQWQGGGVLIASITIDDVVVDQNYSFQKNFYPLYLTERAAYRASVAVDEAVSTIYEVKVRYDADLGANKFTFNPDNIVDNDESLDLNKKYDLQLVRGKRYRFDQQDGQGDNNQNSNNNHPLRFAFSEDGHDHVPFATYDTYRDSVLGSDTETPYGAQLAELYIPFDCPDVIYSKCHNHSGMGHAITIVDPEVISADKKVLNDVVYFAPKNIKYYDDFVDVPTSEVGPTAVNGHYPLYTTYAGALAASLNDAKPVLFNTPDTDDINYYVPGGIGASRLYGTFGFKDLDSLGEKTSYTSETAVQREGNSDQHVFGYGNYNGTSSDNVYYNGEDRSWVYPTRKRFNSAVNSKYIVCADRQLYNYTVDAYDAYGQSGGQILFYDKQTHEYLGHFHPYQNFRDYFGTIGGSSTYKREIAFGMGLAMNEKWLAVGGPGMLAVDLSAGYGSANNTMSGSYHRVGAVVVYDITKPTIDEIYNSAILIVPDEENGFWADQYGGRPIRFGFSVDLDGDRLIVGSPQSSSQNYDSTATGSGNNRLEYYGRSHLYTLDPVSNTATFDKHLDVPFYSNRHNVEITVHDNSGELAWMRGRGYEPNFTKNQAYGTEVAFGDNYIAVSGIASDYQTAYRYDNSKVAIFDKQGNYLHTLTPRQMISQGTEFGCKMIWHGDILFIGAPRDNTFHEINYDEILNGRGAIYIYDYGRSPNPMGDEIILRPGRKSHRPYIAYNYNSSDNDLFGESFAVNDGYLYVTQSFTYERFVYVFKLSDILGHKGRLFAENFATIPVKERGATGINSDFINSSYERAPIVCADNESLSVITYHSQIRLNIWNIGISAEDQILNLSGYYPLYEFKHLAAAESSDGSTTAVDIDGSTYYQPANANYTVFSGGYTLGAASPVAVDGHYPLFESKLDAEFHDPAGESVEFVSSTGFLYYKMSAPTVTTWEGDYDPATSETGPLDIGWNYPLYLTANGAIAASGDNSATTLDVEGTTYYYPGGVFGSNDGSYLVNENNFTQSKLGHLTQYSHNLDGTLVDDPENIYYQFGRTIAATDTYIAVAAPMSQKKIHADDGYNSAPRGTIRVYKYNPDGEDTFITKIVSDAVNTANYYWSYTGQEGMYVSEDGYLYISTYLGNSFTWNGVNYPAGDAIIEFDLNSEDPATIQASEHIYQPQNTNVWTEGTDGYRETYAHGYGGSFSNTQLLLGRAASYDGEYTRNIVVKGNRLFVGAPQSNSYYGTVYIWDRTTKNEIQPIAHAPQDPGGQYGTQRYFGEFLCITDTHLLVHATSNSYSQSGVFAYKLDTLEEDYRLMPNDTISTDFRNEHLLPKGIYWGDYQSMVGRFMQVDNGYLYLATAGQGSNMWMARWKLRDTTENFSGKMPDKVYFFSDLPEVPLDAQNTSSNMRWPKNTVIKNGHMLIGKDSHDSAADWERVWLANLEDDDLSTATILKSPHTFDGTTSFGRYGSLAISNRKTYIGALGAYYKNDDTTTYSGNVYVANLYDVSLMALPVEDSGYYPLYKGEEYATQSGLGTGIPVVYGGKKYYRPNFNAAPALEDGQGWLGKNTDPTDWTFNGDGTATSGGNWYLQTPRTDNVGILDPNKEYTITLVVDSISSGFIKAAFSRDHSFSNQIKWDQLPLHVNISSPGTYTATVTPGSNFDGFVIGSHHYSTALDATISKLEIAEAPSYTTWDGDYTIDQDAPRAVDGHYPVYLTIKEAVLSSPSSEYSVLNGTDGVTYFKPTGTASFDSGVTNENISTHETGPSVIGNSYPMYITHLASNNESAARGGSGLSLRIAVDGVMYYMPIGVNYQTWIAGDFTSSEAIVVNTDGTVDASTGTYPLYTSRFAAENVSWGTGQVQEFEYGGVVYFMPSGTNVTTFTGNTYSEDATFEMPGLNPGTPDVVVPELTHTSMTLLDAAYYEKWSDKQNLYQLEVTHLSDGSLHIKNTSGRSGYIATKVVGSFDGAYLEIGKTYRLKLSASASYATTFFMTRATNAYGHEVYDGGHFDTYAEVAIPADGQSHDFEVDFVADYEYANIRLLQQSAFKEVTIHNIEIIEPGTPADPPIQQPFTKPISVNGYYPLYLTEAHAKLGGNGNIKEIKTLDFTNPTSGNVQTTFFIPNGVRTWEGDYDLATSDIEKLTISGYYPLFYTEAGAEAESPTNSAMTHEVGGLTYFMPHDTFYKTYHGELGLLTTSKQVISTQKQIEFPAEVSDLSGDYPQISVGKDFIAYSQEDQTNEKVFIFSIDGTYQFALDKTELNDSNYSTYTSSGNQYNYWGNAITFGRDESGSATNELYVGEPGNNNSGTQGRVHKFVISSDKQTTYDSVATANNATYTTQQDWNFKMLGSRMTISEKGNYLLLGSYTNYAKHRVLKTSDMTELYSVSNDWSSSYHETLYISEEQDLFLIGMPRRNNYRGQINVYRLSDGTRLGTVMGVNNWRYFGQGSMFVRGNYIINFHNNYMSLCSLETFTVVDTKSYSGEEIYSSSRNTTFYVEDDEANSGNGVFQGTMWMGNYYDYAHFIDPPEASSSGQWGSILKYQWKLDTNTSSSYMYSHTPVWVHDVHNVDRHDALKKINVFSKSQGSNNGSFGNGRSWDLNSAKDTVIAMAKNKDLYQYKYRAVNELPIAKNGYYPLYEIESIANKYSGDGTSTLVNVAVQPEIIDYENDFTSDQNSYGYVSNDWGSSSVRVHDTTEGCLSITDSSSGSSYYLTNLPQDQLYTLEVEVEQTEGAEAQVHTYLLNESGSSGGSHAPRTFYYSGAGRRKFTLEVKTIRNGSSIQFMLKNNNGSGDGTVKLHYIKVSHLDTTQPPVNDYYYYPNNVTYQTWTPKWHEESEKWWVPLAPRYGSQITTYNHPVRMHYAEEHAESGPNAVGGNYPLYDTINGAFDGSKSGYFGAFPNLQSDVAEVEISGVTYFQPTGVSTWSGDYFESGSYDPSPEVIGSFNTRPENLFSNGNFGGWLTAHKQGASFSPITINSSLVINNYTPQGSSGYGLTFNYGLSSEVVIPGPTVRARQDYDVSQYLTFPFVLENIVFTFRDGGKSQTIGNITVDGVLVDDTYGTPASDAAIAAALPQLVNGYYPVYLAEKFAIEESEVYNTGSGSATPYVVNNLLYYMPDNVPYTTWTGDYSDNTPLSIDGYYPLYRSELASNAQSTELGGDGTSVAYTLSDGTMYFMPGLVTSTTWTGDFDAATVDVLPSNINGYFPMYYTSNAAAAAGWGGVSTVNISGVTYFYPTMGPATWFGDFDPATADLVPEDIQGYYPLYKTAAGAGSGYEKLVFETGIRYLKVDGNEYRGSYNRYTWDEMLATEKVFARSTDKDGLRIYGANTIATGGGRILVSSYDRRCEMYDMDGQLLYNIISPIQNPSDFGSGGTNCLISGDMAAIADKSFSYGGQSNCGAVYLFPLYSTPEGYTEEDRPGGGRGTPSGYTHPHKTYGGLPREHVVLKSPEGPINQEQFGLSMAAGHGLLAVGCSPNAASTVVSGQRGRIYFFDLKTGEYKFTIRKGGSDDYSYFGSNAFSIAIGSNMIAVGHQRGGYYYGLVYIYDLEGNYIAKLAQPQTGAQQWSDFGFHLSLTPEYLMVGAKTSTVSTSSQGVVYYFKISDILSGDYKCPNGPSNYWTGRGYEPTHPIAKTDAVDYPDDRIGNASMITTNDKGYSGLRSNDAATWVVGAYGRIFLGAHSHDRYLSHDGVESAGNDYGAVFSVDLEEFDGSTLPSATANSDHTSNWDKIHADRSQQAYSYLGNVFAHDNILFISASYGQNPNSTDRGIVKMYKLAPGAVEGNITEDISVSEVTSNADAQNVSSMGLDQYPQVGALLHSGDSAPIGVSDTLTTLTDPAIEAIGAEWQTISTQFVERIADIENLGNGVLLAGGGDYGQHHTSTTTDRNWNTHSRKLFRSDDNGKTWTISDPARAFEPFFSDESVGTFGSTGNNSYHHERESDTYHSICNLGGGKVLVSVGTNGHHGDQYFIPYILKSDDYGLTWTETHPFANPNHLHEDQSYYNEHYVYPERIFGISCMTHIGGGVVLAGGGVEFMTSGYTGDLRGQLSRSTDYGETWTKVRYLPSTPQLQGNDIFFIEKLSNGNTYIGVNYISHTKLFKSSDDGVTWERLTSWPEPFYMPQNNGNMQVRLITGVTELSNGRVLVSGGSPIGDTTTSFGGIFSFIDAAAFESCDTTATVQVPSSDFIVKDKTNITHNSGTAGAYAPPGLTGGIDFPSGQGSSNDSNGIFVSASHDITTFDGDFTVEFWFNADNFGPDANEYGLNAMVLLDGRPHNGNGAQNLGSIYANASGSGQSNFTLRYHANGSDDISGNISMSCGTWNHVALVRHNGVITLYVNGTADGTHNESQSIVTNPDRPYIGAWGYVEGINTFAFDGKISNVRIGTTAVYTSNFTPPTSNLSVIAGTTFLGLQSTSSANAYQYAQGTTVDGLGFSISIVHDYDGNTEDNSRFDSNLAVVGKEASDVPGLVFAITKTDHYPDSMRSAGVYKSTDYGMNWYHIRGEAEDLTVSMYSVPEYIGGGRVLTGTAVRNSGFANARNALGGQILISDPFLDSANDPASHVSIDSMGGDRSILIDLGADNVAGPGDDVFIQFSAPVSEASGMEGKLGFYDKDGLEIISGPHADGTTEIKIANSVGGTITDYQATLHQPGSYVYNSNTVTASAQAGAVTTGLSDIKHITDGSIQTYWETYGFYGASSAQEWVAFGNPIDATSDTISLYISFTYANYVNNPNSVNVFLEFDDGSQENKLITKDATTGNFDQQEFKWIPDKIDISVTGATGKKITKIGFWGSNFADNVRLWAIEMDGGIVGNVSGAAPDSSYGPALIQEKVLRLDIMETTRGVRYIKMPVISAQSIEKVMKHKL